MLGPRGLRERQPSGGRALRARMLGPRLLDALGRSDVRVDGLWIVS